MIIQVLYYWKNITQYKIQKLKKNLSHMPCVWSIPCIPLETIPFKMSSSCRVLGDAQTLTPDDQHNVFYQGLLAEA